MAYTAGSFVFGETPSASKWNLLWANDASFNDGTGIGNNAITNAKLSTTAVNSGVIDWSTSGNVWWQELGRSTLGGAADTLTSPTFTAKNYIKVYAKILNSGSLNLLFRFNADSGNNYSYKLNTVGSENGQTSQSGILLFSGTTNLQIEANIFLNDAATEKSATYFMSDLGAAGAGNLPGRVHGSGKWANTSARITSISIVNTDTGDMASGSQMVVIAHD